MANDSSRKKEEKQSVEENLNDKYIPKNKLGDLPLNQGIAAQVQEAQAKKDAEKTKQDLDKFKKEIMKKYKYVEAIGVIPAQANPKIEEEFEIQEEDAKKKLMHILLVIPESQFKNIQQVKLEAIKLSKEVNDKFWVHVLTPVDIWNMGLDVKFDVLEALAMSYPVYDKGFLGAIRVAEIHRTLVLKKFEKYVTSYIIAGSLTRGEAKPSSDVDVFIVIDDTDVKRMPRLELKEKIRATIYQYIQEATAIAGVKNILNVQVALLTEFWERVKDAEPVAFTFLRDGIPLYDRGTFLPWKSLLRMGKIKPSPEAVDMFMSSGDRLEEVIDRRIMDIAVLDIYWGVLTPSQGLLMLYGLTPPTPKETVKLIREAFYEKEKLLEKKYVDIIANIVTYYKDYEHGKHKKMTGVQLDKFAKDATDYIKRLKDLRSQIEKRVQEKDIEEHYKNVFGMLESLLKKKTESAILKEFDEKLIKEGKFPPRFLANLKFISEVKKKSDKEKQEIRGKKGKSKENSLRKEVDTARKYSAEITNALIEYTQRCDFLSMDRTRFIIKGKKPAEVFFLKDTFVIEKEKIRKVSGGKLVETKIEDLNSQLSEHKSESTKIDTKALDIIKKEFGDFELSY